MNNSQGTNSFSSQNTGGNQSTGPHNDRRMMLKAEWNSISARLEADLRVHVLRYGRLSEDQTVTLVKTAIVDDVPSDHAWFKRGVLKVRNNTSTWKFRTLSLIEVSRSPFKQIHFQSAH